MTERTRRAAVAAPRQAANGKWEFVVDVRGPDGRRRQARRRGFPTKRAAQAVLDELRQSVREQVYVPPKHQTFGEYLIGHWLSGKRHELKRSTAASYERYLRLHVVPHVGQVRLTELEPAHLDRLYATLRADGGRADGKTGGLSARSLRYVHAIIRAALHDAVRARIIKWDPSDAARPGKATADQERHEMLTWSAEELSRFLAAERGTRYHPLWVFYATTGCRRGEALGLRWCDVTNDYASVVIRQTRVMVDAEPVFDTPKTHKPRVIELDARTCSTLKQLRKAQAPERLLMGAAWRDDDLVFCLPDGRPYHPERVSREFDRRVARHGLKRIRLHDVRHTWATLALAAGADIKVVSERLGHASTAFTRDIYMHVTPTMQKTAAEQVASLIEF